MKRRTFLELAVLFGVAGTLFAPPAPERWSGVVKSVDLGKSTIQMSVIAMAGRPRPSANTVGRVSYGPPTEFLLDEQPAKAEDVKVGFGITATGFVKEGTMYASNISLRALMDK